jgi:DNA-binding transcriptional MerR regulator
MKMERRKFRIGELARKIEVEQFVIRFWEKEFGIKSKRSVGGQRFYDEKDYNEFKKIKELLYIKKFTIAGAKEELKSLGMHREISITPATVEESNKKLKFIPGKLAEQMLDLQNKLIKLRELL